LANSIGPYSKQFRIAKVDGRSHHGRILRALSRELTEAVGGHPTALQRRLIENACITYVRMLLVDEQLSKDGMGEPLAERQSRYYLAWSASLERSLLRLAAMPRARKPASAAPSFEDMLRRIREKPVALHEPCA
jgi:hypothetical protein